MSPQILERPQRFWTNAAESSRLHVRVLALRWFRGLLRLGYAVTMGFVNGAERERLLDKLDACQERLHPPGENQFTRVRFAWNLEVLVNLGEKVGRDLYYGAGFETFEFEIVRKLLGEGDIFVDVGANLGLYTLVASRLVGELGSVHAFEPQAETYQLLADNVRRNHVSNVVLNQAALGETNGEAELFINRESALTSMGRTGRGSVINIQKVPVWTLDDYADRNGIERINFLKVDVEGFEGNVLRGGIGMISRSPDLVVLSELAEKNFQPMGFSVNEVIDWMRALGFVVWMVNDSEKLLEKIDEKAVSYPSNNFIFARPQSLNYDEITAFSSSHVTDF